MINEVRDKFDYSDFDMETINQNSVVNVNIETGVVFELLKEEFTNASFDETMKFFKGKYTNLPRFKEQVTNRLMEIKVETTEGIANGEEPFYPFAKLVAEMHEIFDSVVPFTYAEAFALENAEFRGVVFGTIDVVEMINNLGKEQIAVDGIEVKRKIFNIDGEFEGYKEYHNVYETYKVFGDKLGLDNETMYAVRCWCTSTNEEHWIWIEERYADDPLTAIASTFRLHENIIPHITELKRQGDIMLVETGDKDIEPEGNIRPLTKKEYFDLLTMET